MKRLLLPSLGILVLAATFAAVAATVGAIPTPCTIDISIDGTEFVAPLTSTQPGAVVMQGSYTGTKPSFERAVISLTGSVSTGWPLTISPSTIQVGGNVGLTGNFTVTLVVPAATPHAEVGMVAIAATMTAGGLQCHDTVEGISVTPQAYLDEILWRLNPAELNITGEIGSFQLSVEAKANVAVTISVAFENPPGISIIAPSSISIPAPTGAPMNQTVTVRVSAPDPPAERNPINGSLHATAEGGLSRDATIQSSVNVRSNMIDHPPDVGSLALVAASILAVGAVAVTAMWLRGRGRP